MSMFKCGKCKDTGEIVLFSSRVPCECSPVAPEVGEYYAPHLVSPTAEPGDYQIEWSYRESTSSPEYTLTGKFTVEDVP